VFELGFWVLPPEPPLDDPHAAAAMPIRTTTTIDASRLLTGR
jgi:hypothetical protein